MPFLQQTYLSIGKIKNYPGFEIEWNGSAQSRQLRELSEFLVCILRLTNLEVKWLIDSIQAFDSACCLSRGHLSTLFSNTNISWGKQSAGENKLFTKEPKFYFNYQWKKFNSSGKSHNLWAALNFEDFPNVFSTPIEDRQLICPRKIWTHQ